MLASLLWAASLALIIVAAVACISAKTTVYPIIPELTTTIVTAGVYKLSQNPVPSLLPLFVL